MAIDERSLPTDSAICSCVRCEIVSQTSVGERFLERIEVRPLDVLDQRRGQQALVGDVPDDDRNFEQAGALGGAPAAFAGDDLVAPAIAADDDRLDDPIGPDGGRELVEPAVVHRRAWLELVRSQQIDVDVEGTLGGGGRRIGNERAQAAAERRAFVSHGVAPSVRAWRRRARGTPGQARHTLQRRGISDRR